MIRDYGSKIGHTVCKLVMFRSILVLYNGEKFMFTRILIRGTLSGCFFTRLCVWFNVFSRHVVELSGMLLKFME